MNVDQSRAATLMAVNPLYVKLCVPEGLEHVLEGLAREVLRRQPSNIYKFAATYFHQLLQLRKQIEDDTGCNANVAQVVARGKDMDIAEDGPYHNTWDIPASLMQFIETKEKTFHWQEMPENALVMDDTETMLSLAGNDTEEPANGIFSLSDEGDHHEKLVSNLETLEKNDTESVNDSDETNIVERKSNDISEITAQNITAQNITTQMREVENIIVPQDNIIYKESTLPNDTEGDTMTENVYEDEPKLLGIISTINTTTGHINGNATSNTVTETSNQTLGEMTHPTLVLNVDDGPASEVITGFTERREAIPTGMRQITSGLDMNSQQVISQLEISQGKDVDDPMSPVGKELENNVFILAPLQENKSADNCIIPVKETSQLNDHLSNFQEDMNPNDTETFEQTDPINNDNTQFESSQTVEQNIERNDENSAQVSAEKVVENVDTKEWENDRIKEDISEICSQQNNLMQGTADVNICQHDRMKTNDAELKSAAANDVINALITDELKSHQCEESQLPQSDRNYDMVIAPDSSYQQIITLEDKEGENLKVLNTSEPVDNETINALRNTALNNEDNLICATQTENVPHEEPSSTEITKPFSEITSNSDEMISEQIRTKTPELDSMLPEQEQIPLNEYDSNDAEETNGAMLSNNADENQKKQAEADEGKSIHAAIETNEPLDFKSNQENQADLTDNTTRATAENINEKQKEHSESTVHTIDSTVHELNDTETGTIHSEHTNATQVPTVSNEQDQMHSTSVPNEQDGVVTAEMSLPDTVSATTTEHTKEILASPTGGLPIEGLDEPVPESESTTAFETSQEPLHKEIGEIPDNICEKEVQQSVETAENCTDTHSNDFQAVDSSLTPKQPNANTNIQTDNSNSEECVNFPIELGNGETNPIKDAECHQSNATPLDNVEDSSEPQAEPSEAINSTNSFTVEAEKNCTAGVASEPEEIFPSDKENTDKSGLEQTGETSDTQTDSVDLKNPTAETNGETNAGIFHTRAINYNDDEPASLLYISEHNSNDYANAGETVATNQVISAKQQTEEHGILPVDKDEPMLVENPDAAIVIHENEVEKQCADVVSNPEQFTEDIAEENEIRQSRDEMELQLLPLITEEPASTSLETEQTPLPKDEHQKTLEDENSEKSKEFCETLSSDFETEQHQQENIEESSVAGCKQQEPILKEEDEIKPLQLDEETKCMDLAEENQQSITDELKPKSQEIEETKSLVEEPQTLEEKKALEQGNDDPKPLEDNVQKSFEQQELEELQKELKDFEQEVKVLEQEQKPQEDEEHPQDNVPTKSMEEKDPKPLKEEPESLEEEERNKQENDEPKTREHNAQKSFEQHELETFEQEQKGLDQEPKAQEVDEPLHQEDNVQKSFEQQEQKELELELKEFEQELKVLEKEPKAHEVDEPQQPEDNVPQSSEEKEPQPLEDDEPKSSKDDEPQQLEDNVPQSSEENEPIPLEVEDEEAPPQQDEEPQHLEDNNVPQLSEEKEPKPQEEEPQQPEHNVPKSLEENDLKPLEEPQPLEDLKPVNGELKPVDNKETNLLENEKPHDLEGNERKPLEEEQILHKDSEPNTLTFAEESEVKKTHNVNNEAELKPLDDVKPIQLGIVEEPTVEKSEELESLLENEPMPFEVNEPETDENEILTEYEEPKLLEDIIKPNVANGEDQSVLPPGDENSIQLASTQQTLPNCENEKCQQITSPADDIVKYTANTLEHTDVTNDPDKSTASANTEGSGIDNDKVAERLNEALDVPEITEINSGNKDSEDDSNKSFEQHELKALEQELKEFEQELKVLEQGRKSQQDEEQTLDPLEDNVPKSTEQNALSDDFLHKTKEQLYEVYPQNTNEEFPAQEETIQPEIYQPAVNSKYAGLFPKNILEENHENMSEKYSAANATDNPKIQVDFARDSGCNTPGNDPTSLIDNQTECKIPFADSSQETVIDEQELSDITSNLKSEPPQIMDLQAISDSFPHEQIKDQNSYGGISLSADSNKDEEEQVSRGLQLTIPDADSATFEADSLETNDSGRGGELLSIAPDDSLVELELNSEDVIRNNKLVQTDLIGKS